MSACFNNIEKDCTLILKYGFNTSHPTSISNGMLTAIRCVFETGRLRAEVVRCVPYEPEKENAEVLQKMRNVVDGCKKGTKRADAPSKFHTGID